MKNRVKFRLVIAIMAANIFAIINCENPTDSPKSKPVNIAALQGVTAPVTDETPVTTITGNDQYTGTVTWNGNPDTFAAAMQYTATIMLTPKSDYTLEGVKADFFSVAGAISVSNAANSGVITAVFPKTEKTGGHTSRSVAIDMYDSAGDGWDNGGALRINVNGTDIDNDVRVQNNSDDNIPSGQCNTNTYTFNATSGDVVELYWVEGSYQNENSFIVYYTDTPPSPEFNPNSWSGANALAYRLYNTMDGISGGTLLGSFTVDSNNPINDDTVNIAALQGVTVPVTDETPVTVINENDQYSGTVTWSPDHWTFAAATQYTATITLTPKPSYTLQGVAADFFTVDGAELVSNDANSSVVTVVFPITDAVVINIRALQGVTVPTKGEAPVAVITENDQYTGTVTWSPDHWTFAAATQYTATITLTPKPSYTLQGVAVNFFTVDGAASVNNAANSGVITAVFPKTAATSITSVNITITAPVKGAAPSTTASGTGDYSIGTVSWLPADNPFLGGVVYTAMVTLTANSGYTFTGLSSANINGQSAEKSNNNGLTVTLSHTFPVTDTKTVTNIAIKTPPDKLTYTHGETLELTGLAVTLTHDDTTTEDVAAANFTAKNITTNPAQGSNLVRSTHNDKPVTITYGGLTKTTNNLTVNPKVIAFTIDAIPDQIYTGSAVTPTVTVRDGSTTLTLNTDYTVLYSSNTNIGIAATVTVTGEGNYAGSSGSKTFTIKPKVITFTIDAITAQPYTGSALTPTVTVKDSSTTLTLDTHYTVSYSNNTNAGTATVTVTGVGSYAGSTGNRTFTISPKVITFTVDAISAYTYTGSAFTPIVTVKEGSTTLTLDTHYTVSYSNNTNAGTATANVKGAGNYAGSTGSRTFTINKATPILDDFTISGQLQTYDGVAKTLTVTPKTGKTTGNKTFSYNPGGTTAPTNPGTYTVTFSVATDTNWNAASGFSAGTLKIELNTISAFALWLSKQSANTAATAYTAALNVSDLGGARFTEGSVGNVLYVNNNKFVSLDLSGSTFTSIGEYAFEGCYGLASITIPNSVTSIGPFAFEHCGLTSITIPNSVTSIANGAFSACGDTSVIEPNRFTAINVDASNTIYSSQDGVLYNKAKTTLVAYPGGKTGAFTIPNSVTSIGGYAFSMCTGITGITIPNSVTSIGYAAFSGCSSLAGMLTIPNSVTSIGGFAFYECFKLSGNLTINSASIGDYAFADCRGITGITIGNSVTSIGEQAFNRCNNYNLNSITIGNSVTSIGKGAFANINYLTDINYNAVNLNDLLAEDFIFSGSGKDRSGITINIGTGVTKIPAYLFCFNDEYSDSNKTIAVNFISGSACTSIGVNAFRGCRSLTSISIPNSVKTIGNYAFYFCTRLASVTIPNSVTSIGMYAFSTCGSLASVIIGSGITSIELSLFANCSSLTNITIPNNITSIKGGGFVGCTSLTSVTFQSTIPSSGFENNYYVFPGDLRAKFYASNSSNGTPGTYTRAVNGDTWTKL